MPSFCNMTAPTGPAAHLLRPSIGSVVVGRLNIGPTTHVKPFDDFGEKNACAMMSPIPADPPKVVGFEMKGIIHRPIRFQSLLSDIGRTGWKYVTIRSSFSGPTSFSQLNCSGMLTTSVSGLTTFFASSCVDVGSN